jgi:hypothetical protein
MIAHNHVTARTDMTTPRCGEQLLARRARPHRRHGLRSVNLTYVKEEIIVL